MVIIFSDPNARHQLLEKGLVYTFRKNLRKNSDYEKPRRDWATDRRGGKKICDVKITLLKGWSVFSLVGFPNFSPLIPYVEWSGFKTIDEWVDAIKRLNGGNFPQFGWLYKVCKVNEHNLGNKDELDR